MENFILKTMHIEPHNMSSIPITNMAANYLVKDIWSNSFVIVLDGITWFLSQPVVELIELG